MNYTILDHTADLAIEFYGKTIPELFENSAVSLSEIIFGKNIVRGQGTTLDLIFSDENIEINYIDFLREILYNINQHFYYFYKCEAVILSNSAISIKSSFSQLTKNNIVNEIKAVTYHECNVKEAVRNDHKIFTVKVTFDV